VEAEAEAAVVAEVAAERRAEEVDRAAEHHEAAALAPLRVRPPCHDRRRRRFDARAADLGTVLPTTVHRQGECQHPGDLPQALEIDRVPETLRIAPLLDQAVALVRRLVRGPALAHDPGLERVELPARDLAVLGVLRAATCRTFSTYQTQVAETSVVETSAIGRRAGLEMRPLASAVRWQVALPRSF
jgi:hypothetical protein